LAALVQVYDVQERCLVSPRYTWGRRHLLQLLEVGVANLAGHLEDKEIIALDQVMQTLDAINIIGFLTPTIGFLVPS
jgi:hypothetical protein